jgi:rod shape-determining protein MreD
MRALNVLLLCLAALLAHSTVMKLFTFGAFRPDVALFVLVYVSLKEGSAAGVWVGFGMGLLQDTYMPSSLGVNAFTKSLVGFLVGFLNEREWRIDLWARSFILLAAFFLHDTLAYLFRYGGFGAAMMNFVTRSLPSFAYTLLLWAAIWLIAKRGKPVT